MPVYDFKSIQPTNVNVIDQLLVNHLHAIRLNQDDERWITILEDPFVPPVETIVAVYCVYRKSILDLLQGRIASIESYDF